MKLYWIKEEEGLKFHCIIDTSDAVIPGMEPVPDYVCSHFLKKYGSNSNSIQYWIISNLEPIPVVEPISLLEPIPLMEPIMY